MSAGNGLNGSSVEHDVAGIIEYLLLCSTLRTYQRDHSHALPLASLKQSCGLIRAHDESSRTFSSRLPESRRRFCKI